MSVFNEKDKEYYAIKGYKLNPKLRFNLSQINGFKKTDNNFMDEHVKKKKFVPSPDKYAHHPKFIDPTKKQTILKNDRKLFLDKVIKDMKKN